MRSILILAIGIMAMTANARGTQVLTAGEGEFIVPPGVTEIEVLECAAGGGGGGGAGEHGKPGGSTTFGEVSVQGGEGGEPFGSGKRGETKRTGVAVTPGQKIKFSIGVGGAGGNGGGRGGDGLILIEP